MQKIILLLTTVLLTQSILYSQNFKDTSSVEKTGWLVSYLGHVIWFESDITSRVKDKSFFASGKNFKNGLIVNYNNKANSFKLIAKCYSIKVLLQTDSVRKTAEYLSKESLCIIPVRARVKIRTEVDAEQFDFAGVSFKEKEFEITMEYWSVTTYYVRDVELLRKKDKQKMKRLNLN